MATQVSPVQVKEIAFTGYPVTNIARARAFYEGVLNLKPATIFGETDEFAWIEYELGAATLAVVNIGADKWKPSSDGPSVALEVADFDVTIAYLRAQGVRFTTEPMESPVCWLAVILDPDGNTLAIHKRKIS